MKQSDAYRENSNNCRRLAEDALDEPQRKRYQRMAEAWQALAEEQDWLDGVSSEPSEKQSSPS
ncbi:hypothetical protein V1291_005341 [Nitrobacteraceae bacterium AZCC 1564]